MVKSQHKGLNYTANLIVLVAIGQMSATKTQSHNKLIILVVNSQRSAPMTPTLNKVEARLHHFTIKGQLFNWWNLPKHLQCHCKASYALSHIYSGKLYFTKNIPGISQKFNLKIHIN